MHLPPWDEIFGVLRIQVFPAIVGSFLSALLVRILAGSRSGGAAVVAAIIGGTLAGTWWDSVLRWTLPAAEVFSLRETAAALGPALEGIPGAPPARYWLPWVAGLVCLVETLLRIPGIASSFAWAVRALTAGFTARLLTPVAYRTEMPWLPWAIAGLLLLEWAILFALAERAENGSPALGLAILFHFASLLLFFAQSALLSQTALLAFSILLGPGLLALWLKVDTRPLLAAGVVFLIGLVQIGRHDTFSEVPVLAFLLMAAAPLVLALLWLPKLNQLKGWALAVVCMLLLVLPAMVAVFLAQNAGESAEW